MKAIIVLLLSCLVVNGQSFRELLKTAQHPAANCDTVQESHTAADGTVSSANQYIANRWTAGASYSACKIEVCIGKNSAETANFTLQIRSDDYTSTLGESLVVSSNSVPTTTNYVAFMFSSPVSLTSGTSYRMVVKKSAVTTTQVLWARGNATVEHVTTSTDGSTYTDLSVSRAALFRIYR
jgi:hypothetical protein